MLIQLNNQKFFVVTPSGRELGPFVSEEIALHNINILPLDERQNAKVIPRIVGDQQNKVQTLLG